MQIFKTSKVTREVQIKFESILDGEHYYERILIVENLEWSRDRWYFESVDSPSKMSQRFMTEDQAMIHLQNSETLANLFDG